MANFRYSHLFTKKVGDAAIQAAAAKLNAAEIALAITDGQEKILFKNAEGEVVAVATEEQILALLSQVNQSITNEVTRATSAEQGLQTAIDAEKTRATDAEAALDAKIAAEKTRALGAESDIVDILNGEVTERKANAVASVEYNSSEKAIEFYNANNVKIDSIDATDFIKDGMIDSVSLETTGGTSYLVIVWNTDAGKETTRIDIGDLFDADNYYTKAETDAAIKVETTRATGAEADLQTAINNEEAARKNADVVSMAVDATAGITLTLGGGSTIVATEAEEITLTAGEF